MKVLVTGGAGYLGSCAVRELITQNHEVVVLDDLSQGNRRAINRDARFVEGSVGNRSLVARLLVAEQIEAVLHFAGSNDVEESTILPSKYYQNNVSNLIAIQFRSRSR